MDIGNFDSTKQSQEGVWFEIKSPVDGGVLMGDDGEPVRFLLHGPDSDQYKSRVYKKANKAVQVMLKRGKDSSADLTAESIEADTTQLCAACTANWSRNFTLHGERLEPSFDEAVKLYTRMTWLREQVAELIGDRTRFFKV